MPEVLHTTSLMDGDAPFVDDDGKQTMIDVSDVTMIFNMASQRLNNLKEYFIALARRQLFFKEFTALKDISLTVKRGDVYGIIGTNGSGKSTLLKIIAGVLEPTHGTVTINGHIAPLIELGAGFDMELTARENIYLNGSLLGYPRKFIAQHFDDIVDFAEIRSFLDMPLKNYSSGMVARIAFAIATVIVPEILIVDEVLSVGDFMFQQKCEARIQKLIKEYETTVLIVSHSNDQIERLCNKALWIEKGHMRLCGSAQEVCTAYRALGGHTGSADSEARVFDALEDPIRIPENFYGTITAADVYEASAKSTMVYMPEDQPIKGVTISAAYDDIPRYIALGLFRAFGYAGFISKLEEIPSAVSLALKKIEPEEIVLVERAERPFGERVYEQIRELCPETRIEVIRGASTTELGEASRQWLEGRGVRWSEHAYAITPFCHKEFATLLANDGLDADSTFTALHGEPLMDPMLFIDQLDSTDEALYEQMDTVLDGFGSVVRDVVLLGERFDDRGCVEHLGERGVAARIQQEVEPLTYGDLTGEDFGAERSHSPLAILASVKASEDALSASLLAHRLSAMMLYEDHDNLDSVVETIERVEQCRGAVDGLLFIGDGLCFEPIDKTILSKIALRARLAAGLEQPEPLGVGDATAEDEEPPALPVKSTFNAFTGVALFKP